MKTLNFYNKLVINPTNHCDGICVCWNNTNISVKHHLTYDRYAHLDIHYKPKDKDYSILGVYCPAQEVDKQPYWDHLQDYLNAFTLPWLVLWNFNEMLCSNDKIGGRSLCFHHLNPLLHLMAITSAIIIPCLQNAYSWKARAHKEITLSTKELIELLLALPSQIISSTTILYMQNFTVSDHIQSFFC